MGLVLSVLSVLALVFNNENNFMIAKLTIWVWCGVADELFNKFTDACLQITYMVKQLNYIWLTAEITV